MERLGCVKGTRADAPGITDGWPGLESSKARAAGQTIRQTRWPEPEGKGETPMASIQLTRYEAEEDDLPDMCMRCGAAATVRKRRLFVSHPMWV